MKYLDENGLRRFWQKTKDYVDMNSGGSGGGSLTHLNKDYTIYNITATNGQYYDLLPEPLFEVGRKEVVVKNNNVVGEFDVTEMSEAEIPILTYIVNQMVSALGISVNITRATYITNVSNWSDLFMSGASGFIMVTFTDATMGNVISYYDTNPTTQEDKIGLQREFKVPLNENYFKPVLIWEGYSTQFEDLVFTDNPRKFSFLIMVWRNVNSSSGHVDTNDKIAFSPTATGVMSFVLDTNAFISGYISNKNSFNWTNATNRDSVYIKEIYGIY